MLQLARKTQTDTITWAASSTKSEGIDATGALTRINLRVDVTASGTMASNHATLGLHRIIDALSVKGAGGVHYFSMGDQQIGRMLHLLNRRDGVIPGTGHEKLTTTVSVMFTLHFGSRPFDMYGRPNPFDLSAFIPAFDDTNLKLEWVTTANTVMDASLTISSATAYIETFEVLGTKGDIRQEMNRQGVRQAMMPVSSYESFAHAANKSDLSKQFDVPTGAYLRRIAILVHDDTATRPELADDEVTRVGLILPVGSQRLIDTDFVNLVYGENPASNLAEADVGVTTGIMQNLPGFGVIDFRAHGHPDYGMDLTSMQNGDVKLGVTIENYASGDDSFYWYDQVRPYTKL